jgi:hypothetical protein
MEAWAVMRGGGNGTAASTLEALLDEHRARGFRRNLPFYHSLIADVLIEHEGTDRAKGLLDEATALGEEMSETWAQPELLATSARLANSSAEQGLLLSESYQAAQKQNAKLVEVRVATSLARLWCDQGACERARELLDRVYETLPEYPDLPDLREAKASLDAFRMTTQ